MVYVGKYTHTWMVWFLGHVSCWSFFKDRKLRWTPTPTSRQRPLFRKAGGVFHGGSNPPMVRCLAGPGFGFILFLAEIKC